MLVELTPCSLGQEAMFLEAEEKEGDGVMRGEVRRSGEIEGSAVKTQEGGDLKPGDCDSE